MPSHGYDGNGNPTTYTSPGNPLNGNTVGFVFDPENRMTACGYGLTATYDSDGLRTSKTNSSATTYYVYDEQDHPVVELNASGAVSFVNTFGGNGLLSRRDVVNSASTYYAFDPQGSAVDVMQGGNGLPAAYSAFGIPASGGASSSPWGFGAQWGYYTDGETGLVLCTHRYYDPYTGRWLTRDPSGYFGGVNLYGYVANRPVMAHDHYGLKIEMCAHDPKGLGNFPHMFICCDHSAAPTSPTPESPDSPCEFSPPAPPPSKGPHVDCLGFMPGTDPTNDIGIWSKDEETSDYEDRDIDHRTHCTEQNASPKQEACLCNIINHPPAPPHYGWAFNNCADEAKALLEKCGINPKPAPQYTLW